MSGALLLTEQKVRQFRRVVYTIAHLSRSDIVRVLDFDTQYGMPCLLMDYAPGGFLHHGYAPTPRAHRVLCPTDCDRVAVCPGEGHVGDMEFVRGNAAIPRS